MGFKTVLFFQIAFYVLVIENFKARQTLLGSIQRKEIRNPASNCGDKDQVKPTSADAKSCPLFSTPPFSPPDSDPSWLGLLLSRRVSVSHHR